MQTRRFAFPFILVLATIAVYVNSFAGVFLFDDIIRIVEEERIRSFWPIGSLLSGERPVVDISLAMNYAIGELKPWGYHAFNLAVHILAGLTLFGIVRRTIMRSSKFKAQSSKIDSVQDSNAIDDRQSTIDNAPASHVAFAVALIFLIHPLQTQSVTYIIQRGESMMGLFYLLTLYGAIRAIDSSPRWLWYLAAVVACALGMGTKAVMITAPLIIMIYDWVFLAKTRGEGCAHHPRWPLYAGLFSTWSVLWLCGIAAETLGNSSTTSHVGFSYTGVSTLQYAATQPSVICKYLRLAFWPAQLCLDYDWPVATSWRQIALPAIPIVLLLLMTAWLLFRRNWLGFLGAWFFLILAPTSSIVPIKDLMFEHRMYLPLAAVITAIVVPLGLWLPKQIRNRKSTIGNPIANRHSTIDNPHLDLAFMLLMIALAAPLACATHLRNRDYHSELTMWQDVVAKRPNNARAYVAMGNALAAQGELEGAIETTRQSIQIDPHYADGHCAMGILFARQGQLEEAINYYQTAVRLDMGHSRAWYNLGNAFDRLGRFVEAGHAYEESVKFNPGFADAFTNYGNTLMRQNKTDASIEMFRRAIHINPRHVKAHNNLGDALAKTGDLGGAEAEFKETLRLRPDYHKARINLALLLRSQGRLREALQECEVVLKLDPTHSGAQELRSAILSEIGK